MMQVLLGLVPDTAYKWLLSKKKTWLHGLRAAKVCPIHPVGSQADGDAKYGEQSQGIGGTAEAHPV
jgi:hypothetical protein